MVTVMLPCFDLAQIAASGQCFRLTPDGGGWRLIAKGRVLRLRQEGETVRFFCAQKTFDEVWRDYFDLDTDYRAFVAAPPKEDGYLTRAAAYGSGIRILRQEPWETLVTFLISQRKSIPAIRSAVEALCTRYGRPIRHRGETLYAFPAAKALARCSPDELAGCALGYRVPYIAAAAKRVASGELDLTELETLDDDALLAALTDVFGVGEKIASCVALFGYHRIGMFPRDVWIKRVLHEQYGGAFDLERYAGFAGVMQQYLFYYTRNGAK